MPPNKLEFKIHEKRKKFADHQDEMMDDGLNSFKLYYFIDGQALSYASSEGTMRENRTAPLLQPEITQSFVAAIAVTGVCDTSAIRYS